MRIKNILNNVKGSEHKFCEGFLSSQSSKNYILGINSSVAKTKKQLYHPGSINLDAINAFDLAEISSAHIGQINMIIVSSFCGPAGIIWGYDICKAKQHLNEWGVTSKEIGEDADVAILSINPLINAFSRLTGSVDKNHFPILPGSIVPCAAKYIVQEGEANLYAAQACGIPIDRDRNACLLMEDYGKIPLNVDSKEEYVRDIIKGLVKSIFMIGKNQNVKYKEIIVGIKDVKVEEGEIGCAMVADPYLVLAKDAFPENKSLHEITIDEWENLVSDQFLCKSANLKLNELSFKIDQSINEYIKSK